MAIVRYHSVIAASTGRTEQVQQTPGQLHGIGYSLLANATISIYNASDASNAIGSIVASSAATNEPGYWDFKGVSFRKLTVITTGGILGMTVLYS